MTGMTGMPEINIVGITLHRNTRAVEILKNLTKSASLSTWFLLGTDAFSYPRGLAEHYTTLIPQIDHVSENPNKIYGLGGVILKVDKEDSLRAEFQDLIGEVPIPPRRTMTYIKEHSVVDLLQTDYTILFPATVILDDFGGTKFAVGSDELDNLLSEYFKEKGYTLVQICDHAINRFSLDAQKTIPAMPLP